MKNPKLKKNRKIMYLIMIMTLIKQIMTEKAELLIFQHEECGKCSALKREFKIIKEIVEKEKANVNVRILDCKKEKICKEYDIKGFPKIYLKYKERKMYFLYFEFKGLKEK
jgi:thiol-disulfide isomerase/thioredoxin